jgi:putative ABC transport system substrate-binding protein
MRDLGYTDGQNVVFEGLRGPEDRLPDLAADLVRSNVEVIAAWSGPAVIAAKRRTTSIPIVIASGGDADRTGLVASLARPGGNVTGVSFQDEALLEKRVQLIREIVPGASRVGVLWDSTNPTASIVRAAVANMTKQARLHFELVESLTPADLDKAFEALRRARVDGVVILPAPRYFNQPRVLPKRSPNKRTQPTARRARRGRSTRALDVREDADLGFTLEPPGYALHLWRDGGLVSHVATVGDYLTYTLALRKRQAGV